MNARDEAQKQWNMRACGEIEGEKNTLEYFENVSKQRYSIDDPWILDCFNFQNFNGLDILEIGIGQGADMMEFARAGAICHGVDITDNHLKLTALNAKLRGFDVNLYKVDATKLPFPDGSIDCVYSCGVLHHIPDVELVIKEIRRVLKPGGQVMIALYYKWSAFHIFQKLLANGIRNGWLFSKGYKGLLATIERGADGVQIKPYVKLYSKKEVSCLMRFFEVRELSVYHLKEDHFWPAFLGKSLAEFCKKLESYLGWYVVYKGIKST